MATAIIKEAGWYKETTMDGYEGYECMGKDADELVHTLDENGDLTDIVKDWATDYYNVEDFIEDILECGTPYIDRDNILSDWKDSLDDTIYLYDGDITYFDEGEEVEADFIIESDGTRTDYPDEDEDEDEDDDEEDE